MAIYKHCPPSDWTQDTLGPICIFILPTGVNTRCNPSLCNMISKFSVFCITVSTTCLNILETEGRKLQSWLWGEWNENKPAFLTLKIPVVGFRERWKKKKKQHQTWPNCSFHKKIQLIKTHPTHTHVCAGRGRHTYTHTRPPGAHPAERHEGLKQASKGTEHQWNIQKSLREPGAPVHVCLAHAQKSQSRGIQYLNPVQRKCQTHIKYLTSSTGLEMTSHYAYELHSWGERCQKRKNAQEEIKRSTNYCRIVEVINDL